jgi:hypothetical protein
MNTQVEDMNFNSVEFICPTCNKKYLQPVKFQLVSIGEMKEVSDEHEG